MGDALKNRIKQRDDFPSPISEAMLSVLVAADTLRSLLDRFFAAYEITSGQYNVLQVLKRAGSEGLPRSEIAARMLERAPDVTRLVDRLEKQNLVSRERSDVDRRQSFAKITSKGEELIERITPELAIFTEEMSQKLSWAEWIALTSICAKIYSGSDQTG
ncbi:MAG TPA: MarR family transcriptional regulator [Abditibacterium sp.]|jgi:DNA-binding MarR family transcriptional regulator